MAARASRRAQGFDGGRGGRGRELALARVGQLGFERSNILLLLGGLNLLESGRSDGHPLGSYELMPLEYAKFLLTRWAEVTGSVDYCNF